MKNPRLWLDEETKHWVEEGIIDDLQANSIRQCYPQQDSKSWGMILLSSFGAIMIGLGVILLFAYNWDEMSRFSKMAVILTVLVLTHLFAYQMRIKGKQGLSESLFVLATMLFGAGIWLVAQVYHLDEHYPNAILLWGGGALALAWALPSLPQAIMAIALLLIWHLLEVFDFEFALHHAWVILLFGIVPLIWRLRSPLLARLSSTSLLITLGLVSATVDEHLFASTLLLIATGMIFLAHWGEKQSGSFQKSITREFAKPAYVVFVGTLFLLSFNEISEDVMQVRFKETAVYFYFYGALLFSQGMLIWLVFNRIINPMIIGAELMVILVIYPSLTGEYLSLFLYKEALIFNLILLVQSIWMIIEGSKKADGRKMLWGSLILSALALARYSDMFDSLISRAIVFLVVGAGLFIAGNVYNKNKQEQV